MFLFACFWTRQELACQAPNPQLHHFISHDTHTNILRSPCLRFARVVPQAYQTRPQQGRFAKWSFYPRLCSCDANRSQSSSLYFIALSSRLHLTGIDDDQCSKSPRLQTCRSLQTSHIISGSVARSDTVIARLRGHLFESRPTHVPDADLIGFRIVSRI